MRAVVFIRNYLLLTVALATVAAIPLSEQLEFDQRIESFFADENPDLKMLNASRTVFGGDEFVMVAWSEQRLLQVEGDVYPASLDEILALNVMPKVSEDVVEKIEDTTAKLNAIPGVKSEKTQHLAMILADAPRYKPTRRAMLALFEGTLIGADAQTTGIMLELDTEAAAGISRGETLARIRSVAADMDGEVAVAGEPVQVFDMFLLVEEDSRLLFLVSLAILSTVLLLMFRGLRWLLAPVGLVLGSVVLTRAFLVLVGAELSMVSSMLNSLVTVIGIATFMHVIVHYRDLRNAATESGNAEESAAARKVIATQTLRDMAAPVFWTCLTTAVGFGSLLVSQITPIRSFSTMMCLATGVVLIASVFILPATLASGSRLRVPANVPLEHWLDRALRINCRLVENRPVSTAVICALLFLLAVPGIFRLTLETDFSKNFKDSSSIVHALKFIETRLGGAGSWEVSFETPEELTDDVLEDVKTLTESLRDVTDGDSGVRVLSLSDVAFLPPRKLFGGPAKTMARIRRKQPLMVSNFYNADENRMRILLRSAEQQPSENKIVQIEAIRNCVTKFFDENGERMPQQSSPSASGMFVLLAGLIESLLSDQLNSFLVATGGILLCMTVAFRSLRIGIISLFPNVFPVAMVMGILGWTGMRVNIGTAMITSVSMGLTVDSTIHYITAFERARRNQTVTEALNVAHAGAGRAVVFAHLALIAGFLVLTASRFIPLIYFGALLTLSLIGGVFGDLVLLPLLLRWTTPERTPLIDTDEAAERTDSNSDQDVDCSDDDLNDGERNRSLDEAAEGEV